MEKNIDGKKRMHKILLISVICALVLTGIAILVADFFESDSNSNVTVDEVVFLPYQNEKTVDAQTMSYGMAAKYSDGTTGNLPDMSNYYVASLEMAEDDSLEISSTYTSRAGEETWSFNNVSTGRYGNLQNWQAPQDGIYIIEAWGAEGGKSNGQSGGMNVMGGKGARIKGDFELSQGDSLDILVGQKGEDANCGSGGGGGTFVVKGNDLLVAAGGGGGGFHCHWAGYGLEGVDGQAGQDGTAGNNHPNRPSRPGGTNGQGGSGYFGGGGGGWLSGGYCNTYGDGGGGAYPGNGGRYGGGYGGGGGRYSGCCGGSGGGGGYSGGSVGGSDVTAGGGGGSFNDGDNPDNEGGIRSGHGMVEITYTGGGTSSEYGQEFEEGTGVSMTFNNCSATGRYGPTQGQVNSSYSGTDLAGQVTINTQGVQEWTVPSDGTYTIEVWGAQGNHSVYNGGYGARMKGEFDLDQGQVLSIVVGQQGGTESGNSNRSGGGGGGSFVYENNTLFIAAGGGGGHTGYSGGGYNWRGNSDAEATENGNAGCGWGPGQGGAGGTNGNGGGGAYWGGAGAGWLSNGGDANAYGGNQGGRTRTSGWIGGDPTSYGGIGGFGGGGTGGYAYGGGGGGGGYSGGGAGTDPGSGGGAGSYNDGENQDNEAGINSGHGEVVISTPPNAIATYYKETFSDPLSGDNATEFGTAWRANSDLESARNERIVTEPILVEVANYTFTNCGSTGRTGPNQGDVNSEYSGTSLEGDVSINTQGYQEWIVPETATYTIIAHGAEGGEVNGSNVGGKGAKMQGDFDLNQGEKLIILVGQRGSNPSNYNYEGGGGGGGTYVTEGNNYNSSTALIVAGGGGGATASYQGVNQPGQGGLITNTGTGGGSWGSYHDSGGAGFVGNSQGGYAHSFRNNGIGGNSNYNGDGGFGGGGASIHHPGGGGGGYHGGMGGHNFSTTARGGGSYNNGDNPDNTADTNTGHGLVEIVRYEEMDDPGFDAYEEEERGPYCWVMDNPEPVVRDLNLNELTMHIGLDAGEEDVTELTLDFAAAIYGNCDPMPPVFSNGDEWTYDGVAVSTNGVNWYKVWSPVNPAGWYMHEGFDLLSILPNNSVDSQEDLFIKFMQYGGGAFPDETILWDEITLRANPEVEFLFEVPSLEVSIDADPEPFRIYAEGQGDPDMATVNVNIDGIGAALGGGNTRADPIIYTFNNCGATGYSGPSQAQMNNQYSGTPLDGLITRVGDGMQRWTVPESGLYTIEVRGAQGGNSNNYQGGNGAILRADFELEQGDDYLVLIGQRGINGGSGGGGAGGSYVAKGNNYNSADPFIIAGGGGGGNDYGQDGGNGKDGRTHTSGGDGNRGSGGTNGNGGTSGSCSNSAPAGGGFFTNGECCNCWCGPSGAGKAFRNGGNGGSGCGNGCYFGGFGGGCKTWTSGVGGAAAGGYSGGGAPNHCCGRGGGGGSFIDNSGVNVATSDGQYDGSGTFGGDNIENLNSWRQGHGEVIITYVGGGDPAASEVRFTYERADGIIIDNDPGITEITWSSADENPDDDAVFVGDEFDIEFTISSAEGFAGEIGPFNIQYVSWDNEIINMDLESPYLRVQEFSYADFSEDSMFIANNHGQIPGQENLITLASYDDLEPPGEMIPQEFHNWILDFPTVDDVWLEDTPESHQKYLHIEGGEPGDEGTITVTHGAARGTGDTFVLPITLTSGPASTATVTALDTYMYSMTDILTVSVEDNFGNAAVDWTGKMYIRLDAGEVDFSAEVEVEDDGGSYDGWLYYEFTPADRALHTFFITPWTYIGDGNTIIHFETIAGLSADVSLDVDAGPVHHLLVTPDWDEMGVAPRPENYIYAGETLYLDVQAVDMGDHVSTTYTAPIIAEHNSSATGELEPETWRTETSNVALEMIDGEITVADQLTEFVFYQAAENLEISMKSGINHAVNGRLDLEVRAGPLAELAPIPDPSTMDALHAADGHLLIPVSGTQFFDVLAFDEWGNPVTEYDITDWDADEIIGMMDDAEFQAVDYFSLNDNPDIKEGEYSYMDGMVYITAEDTDEFLEGEVTLQIPVRVFNRLNVWLVDEEIGATEFLLDTPFELRLPVHYKTPAASFPDNLQLLVKCSIYHEVNIQGVEQGEEHVIHTSGAPNGTFRLLYLHADQEGVREYGALIPFESMANALNYDNDNGDNLNYLKVELIDIAGGADMSDFQWNADDDSALIELHAVAAPPASETPSFAPGLAIMILALLAGAVIASLYSKSDEKGRKGKKDEDGVSPVIAIILMVAITIVLAGVLWLWVSGLVDTQKSNDIEYVDTAWESPTLQNDYQLIIENVKDKEFSVEDLEFSLMDGNKVDKSMGQHKVTAIYGKSIDNETIVSFHDGDHDGYLSTGDRFIIKSEDHENYDGTPDPGEARAGYYFALKTKDNELFEVQIEQ